MTNLHMWYLELRKSDNGSFETDKYYTRGTELVSVDITDGVLVHNGCGDELFLSDE